MNKGGHDKGWPPGGYFAPWKNPCLENGPDGVEILRKIKEKDRSIPVIMLTAYDEYKQDFGVWASEAYLVKSSDLEELKAKIREFI